MAQQEFELVYDDVEVQHVSHNAKMLVEIKRLKKEILNEKIKSVEYFKF